MKIFVLLFIVLLKVMPCIAQPVLKGTVTDAETNTPIPYVSIGVMEKPNGTVSGSTGEFSITLNNTVADNDTIKFSSIGYQSRAFSIGEIKALSKAGQLSIILMKQISQLEQVSITAKKLKFRTAGYEVNSKLFSIGFNASGVGSQGGVVIPISHAQTSLETLNFLIIQNSFDHLLFRVNIYEMVNDKPGRNILNQNIFIKVDNRQTGKMAFDLSQYHINADKNILLSLEWIEAQPLESGKIAIGASLFGHTYIRQASQYEWIRRSAGLGISVKTAY